MHGGAILSSGGNACVYYGKGQKYVRKVVEADQAIGESELGRLLSQIDKQQVYGVWPIKHPPNCSLSWEALQQENRRSKGASRDDLQKCGAIVNELRNGIQYCELLVPYLNGTLGAGLPFRRASEALQAIKKMWTGLAYYHKHQIVHLDIKTDNIGYRAPSDTVFFDWGWSTHLTNCKDVQFAYDELRFTNRSTPYDYSVGGPWSPLVVSGPEKHYSCDTLRSLLKFNDVFALALATEMIVDRCVKEGLLTKAFSKNILDLCGDILSNESSWAIVPTQEVAQLMIRSVS